MGKKLKPALTVDEQITLLKSRGLIINDINYAIKILSRVNYYRLSAYSLSLRKNDVFYSEVTFEHVYQLYEFDAKLRHILSEKIELLEIKFRTQIAYFLSMEHGPMSYLKSSLFLNKKHHHNFCKEFEREKNLQSKSAFVDHHNRVYNGQLPIWVAIELFSFGMLSKFYSNFKPVDKAAFTSSYLKWPEYLNTFLISWLKCLVEVRNISAHYGRLYGRALTNTPRLPRELALTELSYKKIFPVLLVIIVALDDHSKATSFITNIKTLIEQYPVAQLNLLGIPPEWETILYKARTIL